MKQHVSKFSVLLFERYARNTTIDTSRTI